MFGSNGYGTTEYGGSGITGNLFTVAVAETVSLVAALRSFVVSKVLSQTVTFVDDISTAITIRISNSVVLTAGVTFVNIMSKHCIETISLISTIVSYMNGYRIGLWDRTARVVTEWAKGARINDADEWTKSARTNDADEWNPSDKQF